MLHVTSDEDAALFLHDARVIDDPLGSLGSATKRNDPARDRLASIANLFAPRIVERSA